MPLVEELLEADRSVRYGILSGVNQGAGAFARRLVNGLPGGAGLLKFGKRRAGGTRSTGKGYWASACGARRLESHL